MMNDFDKTSFAMAEGLVLEKNW